MPEEYVETVRGVHEAWARGDFSRVDIFDPEIEFETIPGVGHGVYHGLEEMGRAWADILRTYGHFRADVEEIIESGDKVVVFTVPTMRPRGADAELTEKAATVWTLRDGKAVRLALYSDRADALREAGLER